MITIHKRFGYESSRLYCHQKSETMSVEVTEVDRCLMKGLERELAEVDGNAEENKVMYIFTTPNEPQACYAAMFWDFTVRFIKWYPFQWGNRVPVNISVKDDDGRLKQATLFDLGLEWAWARSSLLEG